MRVGVLGIGKTPHKIQHSKSLRDLIVEAGRGAIADAGVAPSDIQMLYVGNVGSVGFNYENSTGLMAAHHLGVVPAGAVRVEAACGTGAWALHLGFVAITSGLYDTVMVRRGREDERPGDGRGAPRSSRRPRTPRRSTSPG